MKFWLMNKTDTDADTTDGASKAATDTPPAPDPRPDVEPPRPEPAYEDPRNETGKDEKEPAGEAPAKKTLAEWFTPTRTMALAAAVPSLAALPWAAWAIAHLIPAPIYIGLPLGIVFDLALVGTVALALTSPRIATQASQVGWVAAAAAAAAIALHTGLSGAVLFAVTPLLSKALWQLVIASHRADEAARVQQTRARRAAEEEKAKAEEERRRQEREAAEEEAKADDSSLTVEQRRQLAQLENEAAFTEALAERQRRLDDAKAKAKHEASLAETSRKAQQAMARMDATAKLMMRKAELEEQIELASPPRRQALALGSGSFAPDDASALDGEGGAGFGVGMAQARAGQSPTMRTRSEQQVPTPAQMPARGGAQASAQAGAGNRALVWDTRDRLIEETGQVPSINALANATGLSRRTVARHLETDD